MKTNKTTQNKLRKEIKSLAKDLNKDRDYSVAGYLDEDGLPSVYDRISTGSTTLDKMLNGGIPIGRIVEIFGWESSGKSTLADHILIETQHMGGGAIKLDQENSHHAPRFERMGGDSSLLLVLRPKSIEHAIEDLEKSLGKLKGLRSQDIIDPEAPICIVWDTLHAAPTGSLLEGIKEGNYHSGGMAEKARLLQDLFRYATLAVAENNAVLIILNQLIQNIRQYGAPTTTSGGNALRFFPSIRLMLKKVEEYDGPEGYPVGIRVEVTPRKNKVDAPIGQAQVALSWEKGIDNAQSNFWYLMERGYIKKSGAWCNLRLGQKTLKFYAKDFRKRLEAALGDVWEHVLADMAMNTENWKEDKEGWAYSPQNESETIPEAEGDTQ